MNGIDMSASVAKVMMALDAFHAETPQVVKDSMNPHFRNRFASLGAITKEIEPYLHKVGLTLPQFPCVMPNGEPGLYSLLCHNSGEWIGAASPLMMAKADPQGQGSGLTYLRRYAACSILNIVADEDDDANAASGSPARAERRPASQPGYEEVNGEQIPLTENEEIRRTAPPPSQNDAATTKQINYLKSLLNGAGVAPSEYPGLVNQHCPPWPDSLNNLSKRQCSALIDLYKPS